MNVGIIGGTLDDYDLLDKKLNEVIEIKGTYLFNIVCSPNSLGDKWAENNGSGKRYFFGAFNDYIKELDFAIVFMNEKNLRHPVLEKLKREGKHGTVIIR